MVYAQLVINGMKLGVQAFLVPIRDMETHRPLPGIEVGDIGPKFGFNAKDNGYMIMNKIRIPRKYHLSRYLSLDTEGNVEPKGNPKILYSIMMFTRLQLMTISCIVLGKGLLISIRYGLIRKQFKTVKNS